MHRRWWCIAGDDAPLMRWSCWCTDPAGAPILLVHRSCWCADPADVPILFLHQGWFYWHMSYQFKITLYNKKVKKVLLTVYYGSQCPDSRQFFQHQVLNSCSFDLPRTISWDFFFPFTLNMLITIFSLVQQRRDWSTCLRSTLSLLEKQRCWWRFVLLK